MAKKKRPVPLVPPNHEMKSRKKARQVTSLFHKLTQQLDRAKSQNDEETIAKLEQQLDEMGGREEYQRASQLSTKFHSTSRWVLKVLAQKGMTHGILNEESSSKDSLKNKEMKRPVDILEVGAINTELVEASRKTKRVLKKKDASNSGESQQYHDIPVHHINVKAIDLRSSHPDIEEQDFLKFKVQNAKRGSFDVIVCSMVLNCVTTPEKRGIMLSLLYKQLRPGGFCFFTIPRLCLNQSKFMNRKLFHELLIDGIGFKIDSEKESPKVAFWVLQRPMDADVDGTKMTPWNKKWETTPIINRAVKFRNMFSISLKESEIYMRNDKLN